MFVKYAIIEVTQSLMASRRQHKLAWEVPVLVMRHGPTNVKIFGYEWVYKKDTQTEMQKLTAEAEYERMKQHLDDRGQPVIYAVYGQQMMLHQSLEPIMRECVIIGDRAPIACPPIRGFEPNAEDPLVARRIRAMGKDGKVRGFVGQSIDAFEGGDVDSADEVFESETPPGLRSEADDITLNPKGYVRKADVVSVMNQMGLVADDALSTAQLKNHFGDILAKMCHENGVASEEEGLWGAGENYEDSQLVEMFNRLQLSGHVPLQAVAA